ncbi:hypothetical protein CLOP_g22087 [Closterium sp. NIES-67]|nr:hypothetical protein CLOP_g22087 [Closterium sp. NIES-67]
MATCSKAGTGEAAAGPVAGDGDAAAPGGPAEVAAEMRVWEQQEGQLGRQQGRQQQQQHGQRQEVLHGRGQREPLQEGQQLRQLQQEVW